MVLKDFTNVSTPLRAARAARAARSVARKNIPLSAFNCAQHVLRAQRALSRAQNQGENLIERTIEVRVKNT